MGSLVHVTCDGGDLDVDASIGSGMLGSSAVLGACASCRDVVEVWRELGEPDTVDGAPCPQCGAPLMLLVDNASEEPSGACPRCGGQLSIQWSGLWD